MNALADFLLLGIDGGGSRCRARLCNISGATLSEGVAGAANIRLGVEQSFASVLQATIQCMSGAGLSSGDFERVVACVALAGASEPSQLEAARRHEHPYRMAVFVTDAQAACVGAHGGRDGGIIVIGTGSIGWAELNGRQYQVGGWGWPISDEGSGAWLGCEALRRTLWAHDGRMPWSALLRSLFAKFRSDPHAIVHWMTGASPKDFAAFAPDIVEHALADDPVAVELLRLAGGHVDALARRLIDFGVDRLALVGGLAASIEPWLADSARHHLVAPRGDAVAGA
ncbi:MAG TPA: BadF/BadG/BcrA/BcrD ATPase family protein, partial [Xanthobacteraceae bacterium]|nr:BadF/BadG/BcrA/BcrD ATPase family protein [Xanthobacteraceae bacterium]